jgi:hypothetical protein
MPHAPEYLTVCFVLYQAEQLLTLRATEDLTTPLLSSRPRGHPPSPSSSSALSYWFKYLNPVLLGERERGVRTRRREKETIWRCCCSKVPRSALAAATSWHEQGCNVWQRHRTRLIFHSSSMSMAAGRLVPQPLRLVMRQA